MSNANHSEPASAPLLLLDYEGAAKALSLSRSALRDLVYKGRGPRATRIGRRTLFAVKDLEAFVDRYREPVSIQALPPVIERPRKRGRPTIAELMERKLSG